MHQALPYKTWYTTTTFATSPPLNSLPSSSNQTAAKGRESVEGLIDENAVIIFGLGCCMIHVLQRLLLGLVVNPAVLEVDEEDEQSVVEALKKVGPTGGGSGDCITSLPTVFIGGQWFGDLDRVMATHITGELTPVLKDAGALWL